MEGGTVRRTDLGTAQGGVILLLLVNVYLNYFDVLWESHGKPYGELTGYADDLVVVCKTRRDARQAFGTVKAIMGRLEA